ncbi:MAG TPA: prephenate dehydrogenase/arogenate dehydrogenase family protein [Gemmatimonadaceae bacterium]
MTAEGPFAVLGLGLMGGSLARDLAAGGATVWGYDADASTLRRARRASVIAEIIGDDLARLSGARTVVLAVPVDVAPALLERARPHLDGATLITDVGSTKRRIVAQARALGLAHSFVGSHPMAGDHRAGWSASRRGLFSGARVDLCGDASVPPAVWRRARALWRGVGARPVVRDASTHDAEVAFTSHLPQLLSLALSGTLAARGIAHQRLGAGGRDMTRLAGSDAGMWSAILDDNAAAALDALDACQATLGALRAAVELHDREAVHGVFGVAHRWMEAGERRRPRLRTVVRAER